MYITQTHQERLGHLAAAWWKQSGRSLEAAAVRFPTHQFLQQPVRKDKNMSVNMYDRAQRESSKTINVPAMLSTRSMPGTPESSTA